MKLYFPIFSTGVDGLVFPLTGENPGCGGTQHVTVNLARALACSEKNWLVNLVNPQLFHVEAAPKNLAVISMSQEEFWSQGPGRDREAISIVPAAQIVNTQEAIRSSGRCKLIAWVHHPSYFDHRLLGIEYAFEVFVGAYQFHSCNGWPKGDRTAYIPNLFFAPREALISGEGRKVTPRNKLVFIGALNEAKGFDLVADRWSEIESLVPGATLDVIGSSGTYDGKRPEFSDIPASIKFRKKILECIPLNYIAEERVVFHGNLGIEKNKILRACDIAILNPTGRTDAFPATPLECMAHGLPVVASADFGMSDSMQLFPEINIQNPQEIAQKIQMLYNNNLLYDEISARSRAVAQWYDSLSPSIILRWRRLIYCIIENNLPNPQMDTPYVHVSLPWKMPLRRSRGFLAGCYRFILRRLTIIWDRRYRWWRL